MPLSSIAKPPCSTARYAGMIKVISWPFRSKAAEQEMPTTSASPPVLANGTISEDIIAIFISLFRGSEFPLSSTGHYPSFLKNETDSGGKVMVKEYGRP